MAEEAKKDVLEFTEETPVVREHTLDLDGRTLEYTTTTGRMPLKDEWGNIVAQVFFIAYTKKGADPKKRRLTFSFNGGPGSPSLWLHLGTLGPKRIPMERGGFLPQPPYHLVPNPSTWLDDSDLVFIDPVGTGFSQAKDAETAEKYWGMKGDIESVGEFIRLYLARYQRFSSPVYVVGESYGTTRAAGISQYLVQRGIGLSGIFLVSVVLNFQTLRAWVGNDLPHVLYLPSFAATAWHHGKVDRELFTDFQSFLREVEEFAIGEYASGLLLGDRLPESDAQELARRISLYIGIREKYVRQHKLRVPIMRFCKELRRDEGITVGRLDSRIYGHDLDQGRESIEHDPSMSALMPPYSMAFNDYVRTELGYETDLEYHIFRGVKKDWKWDMPGDGPPDTSAELSAALVRNPHMSIYIASGYFDLATPYFATEHTLAHMSLPNELRDRITIGEYEAGHMMYTHEESLERLHRDIREFYERTFTP